MPSFKRPREKLLELGPQSLTDAELLAVLLRTGYKRKNILDLTKEMIKYRGLKELFELSTKEVIKHKGLGETKTTTLLAVGEIIKRVGENNTKKESITSTSDAVRYVADIRNKSKEYLIGLYLNARNQLIKKKLISIGTLDSGLVHPREVFHPAVRYTSARLILIHNHPSGDPTPSQDDIKTTKRLMNAGMILGIELLDHVIVTSENHYSIMENESL